MEDYMINFTKKALSAATLIIVFASFAFAEGPKQGKSTNKDEVFPDSGFFNNLSDKSQNIGKKAAPSRMPAAFLEEPQPTEGANAVEPAEVIKAPSAKTEQAPVTQEKK